MIIQLFKFRALEKFVGTEFEGAASWWLGLSSSDVTAQQGLRTLLSLNPELQR